MLTAKIKIRLINKECMPKVHKGKGDWIDLKSAIEFVPLSPTIVNNTVQFCRKAIPLGVAMELPAGMEALVAPRSSSNKNYGIIIQNSPGVIDNSYAGNDDEWHCLALFTHIGKEVDSNGKINVGDRICQFRLQPSQFATVWQKIKWLLTSKIEFIVVDHLDSQNRKGLGEGTGTK